MYKTPSASFVIDCTDDDDDDADDDDDDDDDDEEEEEGYIGEGEEDS